MLGVVADVGEQKSAMRDVALGGEHQQRRRLDTGTIRNDSKLIG